MFFFVKKNNNIVFNFHGNVRDKGLDRVTFRGFCYDINNTDIICISDYLLNKYEDLHITWGLSTKKYNADCIYKEVFTYLINLKNYKNIVFTGSSVGGFPSLKYASIFNCTAIIANSQLYLEDYGKWAKNGFYTTKSIVENNNDELVYEDKQIESIIEKYKPKKVIIYNNTKCQTYRRHLQVFIDYIEKSKISNLFEINLFEGIIKDGDPPGITHHGIQYPDDKKHIQILRDFFG